MGPWAHQVHVLQAHVLLDAGGTQVNSIASPGWPECESQCPLAMCVCAYSICKCMLVYTTMQYVLVFVVRSCNMFVACK